MIIILATGRPIRRRESVKIGYFKHGQLPQSLEDLVFHMKVGDVSDVVRTSQGYWIEGGSLAEYLRNTTPGTHAASEVQFIEHKRIHWIQKA